MEPEPPGNLYLLSFFLLQIDPAIGGGVLLFVLILIILLIGSALISGSEVAFFSLEPEEIRMLRAEKSEISNLIIHLRQQSRHLLATILIANNLINVAIVILSDYILRVLLSPQWFLDWGSYIAANADLGIEPSEWAVGLRFIITIVGVTFLLVLVGEVAPKVYARLNNLTLSRIMARPLNVLGYVFYPLTALLVRWSSYLEEKISAKGYTKSGSKEEIDKAIDLTVDQEEGGWEEADILKSIVKFGDVTVKQVMIPRTNIVALEEEQSLQHVFDLIKESGYSRIPVYKEDLDNISGILYAKDLIGYYNQENELFDWKMVVRDVSIYVPETKKIDELLKEIQMERTHMAIVVDEFGGTAGLITLEDILEEVVGEIHDEFDEEEDKDALRVSPGSYIFEGKVSISDACRTMELDTSTFDEVRGEADSIAGLILEFLGEIPSEGQEFSINKYKFRILLVTDKRVERVKITKL